MTSRSRIAGRGLLLGCRAGGHPATALGIRRPRLEPRPESPEPTTLPLSHAAAAAGFHAGAAAPP